MTSIVGILCKDGVVIATDSAATFVAAHGPTIEQRTQKLEVFDRWPVVIAGAGATGLNQRFCAIAQHCWNDETKYDDKKFREHPPIELAKSLTQKTLQDFGSTFLAAGDPQMLAPPYGALFGFASGKNAILCEFESETFQPELKNDALWYCSLGSAQAITDTFLALMREVFWQDGPPVVRAGIFAAVWTLQHAIDINPGGVNGPIQMAVIERNEKKRFEAKQLTLDDLAQHKQSVEDAKNHLRDFRNILRGTAEDIPIPAVPKPV